MRRVFWFVVGTTAGVYAVTRLKKRAHALAPESLQASVDRLAIAIRHFGDEVRAGMAERETELREALGIDTGTDTGTASGTSTIRGTAASDTQREDYR